MNEIKYYETLEIVDDQNRQILPPDLIVDVDFKNITIGNIGDDMTSDQKEKAQEVVVPVIFVFPVNVVTPTKLELPVTFNALGVVA